MNLLLDTHIALWAITGSPKLPPAARQLIVDSGNSISVSVASVWEIAIKHAHRPAHMPVSGHDAAGYFREAGYRLLYVSVQHVLGLETIPPIHHDPFDRILVAQALTEPLRLVTHDHSVARYSDTIIRV